MPFGDALLDRYVAALDETGVRKALAESRELQRGRLRRAGQEKSDHRYRRLLRARRERPCRRAAEKGDELAPSPTLIRMCPLPVRGTAPYPTQNGGSRSGGSVTCCGVRPETHGISGYVQWHFHAGSCDTPSG